MGDDIPQVSPYHDGKHRHFRLTARREGESGGDRLAQTQRCHRPRKPRREHRDEQNVGDTGGDHPRQFTRCDAEELHADPAPDEELRGQHSLDRWSEMIRPARDRIAVTIISPRIKAPNRPIRSPPFQPTNAASTISPSSCHGKVLTGAPIGLLSAASWTCVGMTGAGVTIMSTRVA